MALDDEIRILSGVRLFEGFSQEQLRLLAFGAETMHLAADRKLYREDDEADSAYVVIKGTISLFREQGDQRIPVGTAEAGAMLGELALIADTRRLTSAAAATNAEILRLNRKMFHRILEEYPDLAITLRQRIVDDLQALVRRIEEVAARFES
jgi:CRP-like cAMP-binding protein